MKKNKYILSLTILLILFFTSCRKFVDVTPPKNQLVPSKVFSDSTNANSAIVGIYIDMYQSFGLGFASGGLTAYPGLSADELSQTSNDQNIVQFFDNRIDVRNDYNQGLWSGAYKYIYDANACIEGINASSKIPLNVKGRLLGEVKQIRAFLYFNLTNLYGKVPLIRSTDYRINQTLPRASVDSVYAQILSDISFAQSNLPKNSNAERANYYSASALLAKIQLYRKNYSEAEAAANLVINSGNYQLESDLNKVFLAGSIESIWTMVPVIPGYETWEGYVFVPSDPTASPQYVLNNSLFNSFETSDLRKTKWTNVNNISGINYPYPFKYKAATTSGIATENYTIFRLAEIYLIRAEARANLNDMSGAQSDLNLIRNRAGLPNTTITDKSSLLLAVEKERRLELFCEWGNRWFDLQRTNRADAVLSGVKSNWNHNDILYPVPDAELKTNPALTQNSGY